MFRHILESLRMSSLFPFYESYFNETVLTAIPDADIDPLFWSTLPQKEEPERQHHLQFYLYTLSTCGVLFNVFVLITTLSSLTLRKMRSNDLVVSLSLADLLICAGVMPLTPTMYTVQVDQRNDALNICTLWMFFTTFSCVSSSFNVVIIAIDRYIFITSPMAYVRKFTNMRICILLLMVWMSALLLAAITFIFNTLLDTKLVSISNATQINSTSDPADNITGTYGHEAFGRCDKNPHHGNSIMLVSVVLFLPSFIVAFLNCKIYRIVNKHATLLRTSLRLSKTSTDEGSSSNKVSFVDINTEVSGRKSSLPEGKSPGPTFSELLASDGNQRPSISREEAGAAKPALWISVNKGRMSIPSSLTRWPGELRASFLRRENKASCVLSVIIGTYLLCWLPLGIFVLVHTTLDMDMDVDAHNILLVLGYSNSCWNPIIYAGFNNEFRSSVRRRFERFMRIRRAKSLSL